jgi:hypothetical protein
MPTFYVHIPCYVTEGRPEITRTPNRIVPVAVDAPSEHLAIEKTARALGDLVYLSGRASNAIDGDQNAIDELNAAAGRLSNALEKK